MKKKSRASALHVFQEQEGDKSIGVRRKALRSEIHLDLESWIDTLPIYNTSHVLGIGTIKRMESNYEIILNERSSHDMRDCDPVSTS